MGIYNKLAAIQKELIAPKGQRNDFGKYNYRSCEDILKALKPLCDSNNCLTYISNELECIGNRNYVKAIVHFVDLETGEEIVSTAHAREEETKKGMDGSQITGASSSYARKYALAGIFCIDNEKDSDATNKGEDIKHADQVEEAKARAEVLSYINEVGMSKENVDKICKFYKVTSIQQMTTEQCKHYMKNAGGK
ncbi:MAG: ERF family protein [Bacteroidales bacterium]|nr:ERF family protein [Candidatus Scybalousia scybalohippi]